MIHSLLIETLEADAVGRRAAGIGPVHGQRRRCYRRRRTRCGQRGRVRHLPARGELFAGQCGLRRCRHRRSRGIVVRAHWITRLSISSCRIRPTCRPRRPATPMSSRSPPDRPGPGTRVSTAGWSSTRCVIGGRTAGRRRFYVAGPVGSVWRRQVTGIVAVDRAERRSHCFTDDSVRPGAVGASAVAGSHRPDQARMPDRGAGRDPGGQAVTDGSGSGDSERAGADTWAGVASRRPAATSSNPTASWSPSARAGAARTIRCATPATGAVGLRTSEVSRAVVVGTSRRPSTTP